MAKNLSGPVHAILVGRPERRHLRVPKAILPFGDTTVLGRTLRIYLDAGFPQITVVLGYKADTIAATLEPLPANVRLVRNPLHEEGISSFLRVAMRELPPSAGGFLIGLTEQPTLTPELLKELEAAFRASDRPILIPTWQGSLGMPAFFEATFAQRMLALSPKETLWDLIKRHGNEVEDHPTGYSSVVRSIEDQEDYHALLRMAGLPIPVADPAPEPPATAESEEAASDPAVS